VKRLEKKHFIPVIIKSNLEREAITGIWSDMERIGDKSMTASHTQKEVEK
jgi:hypothetical protein